MLKRVAIFGSGGHARVVFDILKQCDTYEPSCFYTISKLTNEIYSTPVLVETSGLENLDFNRGIVAVGDNYLRSQIVKKIKSLRPNFKFINAIHPKAIISPTVKMGVGNCIMAGTTIEFASEVSDHSVINTAASVNHDCNLEEFVNISPNATLGGMCRVGKFSTICIGATILNNINIEENVVLGAGSIATKNLTKNTLYYGVPARPIRPRKLTDRII